MKTKLDTFEKLQEKIISGDRKAMVRFVELTYLNVFQTAFRIARNIQDAEDICQDAFAHFFSSLGKFEGKSSLKTWLYRITVNCAIDAIRKRKITATELNEELVKIENPDILKNIGKKELSEKIQSAIRELKPQQKAVFSLKHFEGMTFDQIAEIMEISPSTAKTHFYRAIAIFRELLREYAEK